MIGGSLPSQLAAHGRLENKPVFADTLPVFRAKLSFKGQEVLVGRNNCFALFCQQVSFIAGSRPLFLCTENRRPATAIAVRVDCRTIQPIPRVLNERAT
jgi:hypothetical protein